MAIDQQHTPLCAKKKAPHHWLVSVLQPQIFEDSCIHCSQKKKGFMYSCHG
jgi:hypothetical protein